LVVGDEQHPKSFWGGGEKMNTKGVGAMRRGKLIGRIFGIALVLVMVVAVSVISPPPVRAEDDVVKVQLAMILDGSESIEPDEWSAIVNGLASAVNNSACIPHDGTVELTVVQFGYSADYDYAQVEVEPVVITSANANTIAAQIQIMGQGDGLTPMAYGIHLAADTLAASPNFDPDRKQALNLVTDGWPSVCDNTLSCPLSCGGTIESREANVVCARDYAIQILEMTDVQDIICSEAIGDGTDVDLLREIVFPQPGCDWPIAQPSPTCSGWVRQVADAGEFADTICEKLEILLYGSITAHKFNDVNGDGEQDVGEDDLEGWTMTLYEGSDCSGDAVGSGTTNSNGNVVFTGVEAGTYSVKETLEGGWTNSTALCQHVTIAAGESATLNFGNAEIPLDHFKCYWVEGGQSLEEYVTLADQFDTFKATVKDAEFFCNPVEKVHGNVTTPILHPDHHLTFYTIDCEEELQTWQVQVDNQFGTQNLTVEGPVGLAVPTCKLYPGNHTEPIGLDHYLLYKVILVAPMKVFVGLNDEFSDEPGVLLTEPVYFANPVQKILDWGWGCAGPPEVEELKNPEAHLVFYPEIVANKFVGIKNQFFVEDWLNVIGSHLLAVPSEMISPETIIATAAYGTPMAEEVQTLLGLLVLVSVPAALWVRRRRGRGSKYT